MQMDVAQAQNAMAEEIGHLLNVLARKVRSVRAWLGLRTAKFQARREEEIRSDERQKERERIARDLHDTLLQSFQALLLRFQAVSELLPAGDIKQRLDRVIDQAAQTIGEGRDAVKGLRMSTVGESDIAAAVGSLARELTCAQRNQNYPLFHVLVGGATRELHTLVRDEVYRIAGEGIRNAFRHAQASRIEVEVLYGRREFRLHVRDNGKGIDLQDLEEQGWSGHWGLQGMRERALRIGARLELWSLRGTGTEVTLQIPAAKAYKSRSRQP